MDEHELVSRRPRHEAQPDAACRLEVTVISTSEVFAAQLSDLSRKGLKAITDREMPSQDVRVQIELPSAKLQLSPKASVRWSRLQDNGEWASGLLFDQELPWEVMGELFLNDVLCSDVTPSFRTPYAV